MKSDTPIRRQYLDIKKKHSDALLLFRLGDFYEAFDDDARILARELDIVLTSKPLGKNLRVPLAGVPFHALDRHLATLISRGFRVAVCEQVSDIPVKDGQGKRLIEREVVRVVTPGTVIEPSLLDGKTNNYIAAVKSDGKTTGIAYAEVSTGEFRATEIDNTLAVAELQRIAPSEILFAAAENSSENDSAKEIGGFAVYLSAEHFLPESAQKALFKHFQTKSLEPFGLADAPLAAAASGALITYLKSTQTETLDQLTRLTFYDTSRYMLLDGHTLKSLEVFESASGGATLISVIDRTKTASGSRLLRRWLRQPLNEVSEIIRRQEHIAYFVENDSAREKLTHLLESINDIERLTARTKAFLAVPNEVSALGKSLEKIPFVRRILQGDIGKFGTILTNLPECQKEAELIERGINSDLPWRSNEISGVIKEGYSEELDKLRRTLRDGKGYLADLEARERARTGIKSLRVSFNKVFGYFIEITKSNLHLAPPDFVRKQTLVNAERFVTLELKEYESLVLNSQERLNELEKRLFRQVCAEIGKNRQQLQTAARLIAYLDVITALATIAAEQNYARPQISEAPIVRIKKGRHPIVEQSTNENFIANDTILGGEQSTPLIALITGPNASGKSTYLRQTALIQILAQIGSFVPAESAEIGICDRIFTRIGLYDRIGVGESTFITEMIETAEILHHATGKSLILLDELGRGTSTFDGLAVARACIEYIHNHPKIAARTLFATHYHELAELEELLPRLKNLQVEIEESEGNIKFLYKITTGRSGKSYGIFAAKLAGLPKPVIKRAQELLRIYEDKPQNIEKTFEDRSETENKLLNLDIESLSPVEALMKLYEMKNGLRKQEKSKKGASG